MWDPAGPTPTWTNNCADKSATCVGEGQELSSGACVCSISNGFYGTPSFVNPFSSTAAHWAGTCTTCTEVSRAPTCPVACRCTHAPWITASSPPPHHYISNLDAKRLLASAWPPPP